MINYLIISLLSLSVGVSQQNWNMELMKEYGGLIYSPNSNKPYTGDIYSIYVNGKKKLEGKYNNGIKDGLWIEWYKNGQKMENGLGGIRMDRKKKKEFSRVGKRMDYSHVGMKMDRSIKKEPTRKGN